jgi:hypothetical protein
MLSPEISRRLGRLVASHKTGLFTDEEFAIQLGGLGSFVTTENINTLLSQLPVELHGTVKRGISLDNQQAADDECLRPEDSPLDPLCNFGEYYRKVTETLLESDESERRSILSVICLPSFQVEWAVRLLGSERSGYLLSLSVAETQIWCHSATTPVAVNCLEVPLSRELAALMGVVWRKMLLCVRHPQSCRLGKDGVTYHFACHDLGVGFMAGKTWSPNRQTAPGRLVAFSHLLYRYVEQDEAERTRLADEIQQAAEWFRRLA